MAVNLWSFNHFTTLAVSRPSGAPTVAASTKNAFTSSSSIGGS
ncbi:uncharacterized protein METZ01_LOCUS245895, partial [marine metagenome]